MAIRWFSFGFRGESSGANLNQSNESIESNESRVAKPKTSTNQDRQAFREEFNAPPQGHSNRLTDSRETAFWMKKTLNQTTTLSDEVPYHF